MDRYEEALERAKKGLPIDEVFPELKESEDERIRKQIEQVLIEHDWSATYKVSKDDCLAYLERQKDIDCLACDQHLKGYIAGRKVTEEEKQKEQKPAEWSEEDELMREAILETLERVGDYGTIGMQKDWLKSLRPHWKPSEEQMYSLGTVVKGYDNCTVGSVGYNLKELYEDLKKL